MKQIFITVIAITSLLNLNAQSKTNEDLTRKIKENIKTQVELLEAYNQQIKKDLDDLKTKFQISTDLDSNRNPIIKEKPSTPKYSSVETIFGISDNEGLVNLTNFHIEINTIKNQGLEMGLFVDVNDIKSQNIEIPSEVFIFNLGYTKQLNFLSSKSKTVATRVVIGGSFGTEVLNNGSEELSTGALLENKGGLIYGGYVGAFSTFKINQRFSAVVRTSNYFTSSDVSLHKFIVGAGLRYNF